ncbi:DNA repair protein RadA [Candidatus Tenderia electrophaga]|jgi:DNA repair protein RadA/Sms|uniref:DNA repair protein RadA n=1 Tax=Candidatus Tenderia electrophaga TaxID=1748243 RepID=A0A0S2TCS6_9GAMM|nr:DNA repair protein RadA [Candidatus Tenderia electrophaga]
MAKSKTVYSCTECGAQQPKWAGQCPDCNAWNAMVEVVAVAAPAKSNPRFSGYAGSAEAVVQSLAEVKPGDVARTPTGQTELDRVLGGGLVPGSVILIGGDPGIGKSTLLLQTLALLSEQLNTLYVTGEESLEQVSMRAHRLNLTADKVRLLAETNIEAILNHARNEQPQVVVIDSIQTIYTELLQSAPGAVAQVRESAAQLVRYAKKSGTALFLVGHVTKEGTLAGPRVLEHMVDTVLYFEGDSSSQFRVVRAIKNRFGAVNELGVFAMTEKGLKEVSNPSAIFLSRHQEQVPGSVIMVTREGSRPLLVEVQALVAESHLGNPRRVTVGLDQNRLAMLLAVLQRHGGIATYDQDVFINVVGGVRVTETAADLPLLLAGLSSLRNRPLPKDMIVFGEVGLAGEIRPVQGGLERLKEAAKHGFKRAVVPKANAPKRGSLQDMEIIAVERLGDAVDVF